MRALLFVSLLALVAGSLADNGDSDCTSDAWQMVRAKGTAPEVLSAHAMVSHHQSLYVFGGFLEAFAAGVTTFYNVLYQFNTNTETWTILDDGSGTAFPVHPTPRAYSGYAADDHALYIFGGIQYNADFTYFALFDELWRWDFAHGGWTLLSTGRGPGTKADLSMTIGNGNLYIVGGIKDAAETDTSDLWEYNIAADRWTLLAADGAAGGPAKRHNPRLHFNPDDNNLYMNAGQQVDSATDQFAFLNDTWVFPTVPTVGPWSNITPLNPANNFNPSTTYAQHVISDSIFAVYGGDFQGGPSNCGAPAPQLVVRDLWVMDTSTRPIIWRQKNIPFTPPAIKRGAGALIGDCFYVHGGWDFPFCPPGQVWNNLIWKIKIENDN